MLRAFGRWLSKNWEVAEAERARIIKGSVWELAKYSCLLMGSAAFGLVMLFAGVLTLVVRKEPPFPLWVPWLIAIAWAEQYRRRKLLECGRARAAPASSE